MGEGVPVAIYCQLISFRNVLLIARTVWAKAYRSRFIVNSSPFAMSCLLRAPYGRRRTGRDLLSTHLLSQCPAYCAHRMGEGVPVAIYCQLISFRNVLLI